jgi:hypothetical protein
MPIDKCQSCRNTNTSFCTTCDRSYSHFEPISQVSDGSTADYYKLPDGSTQLQNLISYRNMNAQLGEIFRACYLYGLVKHSPKIRDIKKIIYYATAELERLEKYGE